MILIPVTERYRVKFELSVRGKGIGGLDLGDGAFDEIGDFAAHTTVNQDGILDRPRRCFRCPGQQ